MPPQSSDTSPNGAGRPQLSAVEAAVQACYSTWATTYYDEYYGERAPYPPVHTALVRRLLNEANAHWVLDAGCGPASMLRELLAAGFETAGFDLSPDMVAEAKRVVASLGRDPSSVWQGSVADPDAYGADAGHFDAAISVGVFPHLPSDYDRVAVELLRDAVRPGGTVLIEARNALFALFTLNRYSSDLFVDSLIPVSDLRKSTGNDHALDDALNTLAERFRMDLPPIRRGKEGEPGYDEVVSRTHNPFELRAVAEAAGLVDVRVAFYHFHAVPPMLVTPEIADAVRDASLAMEADPFDWRGHVMASAFFVIGKRP